MEQTRRHTSHRSPGDAAVGNEQNENTKTSTTIKRRSSHSEEHTALTPLTRVIPERIMEKTREKHTQRVQYRKRNDLKLAFSEFYLMLVLLQNYQTLNFTGFRKILKKHDKLFQTTRGEEWRKLHIDSAPFHTSKRVEQLINDVETVYSDALESGDRARAMKRLRVPPLEEKQSPAVTFRVGIFVGKESFFFSLQK
jgi:SPX domain protein involved in polyphosphate accumulation